MTDTTTTDTLTKSTQAAKAPKTVPVTTKARPVRKPLSLSPELARAKPVTTAPTVQPLPAYAGLSFVKGRRGPHGFQCSSWFAVPDEEWFEGRITGVKAFQELQRWVKAEGVQRTYIQARWMVEEAFKVLASDTNTGRSKRGAAVSFIDCAFQFLAAAVANESGGWLAGQVVQEQKARVDYQHHKALDRAAFVERMQAARATKRAARALEGMGGAA